MPNRNDVKITGHLGRDPEKRFTKTGKPFSFFSLAVTEKWKDKQGDSQESTQWIPFISWGKPSEIICSNFKKGDAVEVTGKVRIKKKDEGYDEIQLEALFFSRPVYKVAETPQQPSFETHPDFESSNSGIEPEDLLF